MEFLPEFRRIESDPGIYAQSSKGLNIDHNRINEPGGLTGGSYVGAYFAEPKILIQVQRRELERDCVRARIAADQLGIQRDRSQDNISWLLARRGPSSPTIVSVTRSELRRGSSHYDPLDPELNLQQIRAPERSPARVHVV